MALVTALTLNGAAAAASTLTVCASGCDYTSIKDAVNAASSGDTVSVGAGTYYESGIVISKALTLSGAGIGSTIIDESADTSAGNIIEIKDVTSGQVVVEGLSIETGAATTTGSNGIFIKNVSNGVTVKIRDSAVRGRQGTSDIAQDNFPVYAQNPSGGSTASLEITGNTLYGGGDNTLLLEGWRGPLLVSGNTIYRPKQDTSTTSVIFAMNYGNLDATGTQVYEDNVFEMGGGTIRTDVLTVASGFNSFNSNGVAALGTGGFDSVIFRDNTINGLVSTSRGVILWDQTNASDSAIDAVVSGNTFSGVSTNFGVRITGPDVTTDIRNNDFSGVNTAVRAFPFGTITGPAAASTTVVSNSLATTVGSPKVGVNWTGATGTLDAGGNWWGCSDGANAGTCTVTSGSVTTAPWLSSYTPDPTRSGDPGFWPIDVAEVSATSSGSNVAETFDNAGLTLTFDSVSSGGTTTVTALDSGDPGYVAPSGFSLGSPAVYYEVATTASFTGSIDVCFSYGSGTTFSGLRPQLLHYDGTAWEDVTTSVDETNRVVCGSVDSLSPLALGSGLPRPVTINAASDTKTYDGGTSSTGTPAVDSSTPLVSGDHLDGCTQSFDSASASTTAGDKTLTASGCSILDASDNDVTSTYDITYQTATGTINKASQAINVTTAAPASAAFGSTFPVAATADSGLTVAITTSGGCSGSGSGSTTITMTSGSTACTVAYNQAGNGNYNAATEVTSTTTAQMLSQAITVTQHAPASAAFGSTFNVAATADSGLTVAITTSGGCSGSGSGSATITMTSSSTSCTVHYNQAGDGTYDPAPEVTETTTAAPATGRTIQYSGDTYAVAGTTSVVLKAQLAGPSSCLGNQPVTFKVDKDANGSYETVLNVGPIYTDSAGLATYSSLSVLASTIYEIEVSVAAGDCNYAVNTAVLVVAGSGDSSNGGGWYKNPGRINFGYTVQVKAATKTTPAIVTGQMSWHVSGKTRFKGAVTAYTKTCPTWVTGTYTGTCGYLSGTGSLYSWNAATSSWDLTASNVGFRTAVADGGSATTCVKKTCTVTLKPDYFAMDFPSATVLGEATTWFQLNGGNLTVK